MMKYCEGMSLSLNEAVSSRILMGAPWEDIMQEEQLRKIFYTQGYGGQPFIRIQKHISRHVMYVKEQAGHRGGMKSL